jgi:hypothetical protein
MAAPVSDDGRTRFAVRWLTESPEPAIRALARTELLDEPADERIASGPMVHALIGGDEPGEVLRVHPYTKWVGAHWRLVSLIELDVPVEDPRLSPLVDHVLTWLTAPGRLSGVPEVAGRTRRCASQEGNALAVCSRLGLAGDERVRMLAESLVSWQWPDGGWNCDRRPEARHSSFHETHPPIWGLHEYARATGDVNAAAAARRGAELLLGRHLFRRRSDGGIVHRSWVALHYPPYWHYDILQGLLVLSRLGLVRDERADDALDLLERRRLSDGRWRPGGYWWHPPGSSRAREIVDWGRSGPNYMITLNALRVLRAAGRIA